MQLNLPILDRLQNSQHILIAGAGGGFDIFAGLPLYFTLRDLGKTVHLANYSFTDFTLAEAACQQPMEKLFPKVLQGTRGGVTANLPYLPEPLLADWFRNQRSEEVIVWMLVGEGAQPATEGYRSLVDHLGIEAIILVDGGVDSIMRGNEAGAGTLLEDSITLTAVSALTDVPVKIQACIGFGTEVEENVCHYNALENMAALVKAGAFWGSCALTPEMEVFKLYESACLYVWEQPGHHKSHISTRVIPAVRGEFGNHHLYDYHKGTNILVSPLMSLYWFFDARTVIDHNELIDVLRGTRTKREAMLRGSDYIFKQENLRPRRDLPY